MEASAAKGADYPFEVHFKGKPSQGHGNSPWTLNATSNVSCVCVCVLTTAGEKFNGLCSVDTLKTVAMYVHCYGESGFT